MVLLRSSACVAEYDCRSWLERRRLVDNLRGFDLETVSYQADLGWVHLGIWGALIVRNLDEGVDEISSVNLVTSNESDGRVGVAPHPASLGRVAGHGALEGLDVNLELEGPQSVGDEEARDLARLEDRGQLVLSTGTCEIVLEDLDTDARGVREDAVAGAPACMAFALDIRAHEAVSGARAYPPPAILW